VLLGSQQPRFSLVPPARSSAGQEVIDLAASAGLFLDAHQQLVLNGALGERRDGRWAAVEVADIEPRQNGKGGTITARQLGGLYLFGEELQTYTAHRMDAVKVQFQKLRELIEASPDLSRRVGQFSQSGLELAACGNTMKSQNVSLKDLLPGFISADKGGVVRAAELQSQGYLYLRP